MLTAAQHQRIDRYLAELSGALGDLPATEREDVVGGVREHIQAALADRSTVTDADVDQVLRALGDPLTIAATATGGRDAPMPESERDVPVLQRDWIPGAVVATLLLGPLILPFFVSFGGILLLPLLLVVSWAVLWISPLWTALEKLAGSFLLPALGTSLLFGLIGVGSTETCMSSSSTNGDTSEVCTTDGGVLAPAAAWAVLVAAAVASIATAVVLYRNGRRRAQMRGERQSFSTGA